MPKLNKPWERGYATLQHEATAAMLQGTRGSVFRLRSAVYHASGSHRIPSINGLASPQCMRARLFPPISSFKQRAFGEQTRPITTIITSPPDPSRWPRRIRVALYILLFGSLSSYMTSELLIPFIYPTSDPDSPEDARFLMKLKAKLDRLPVVKKQSADPAYVESDPYGNLTEDEKRSRFTSGSLRGSRGFSCQRIFYSEEENKVRMLVFLGLGIQGWPTVVHGGAIATLLDETMSRVAEKLSGRIGAISNLNVTYTAPLAPCQYISVDAQYNELLSTDTTVVVDAIVVAGSGKVCSIARAHFARSDELE